MNRRFLEKIKLIESFRIPFFGGLWYNYIRKLDNKLILKEKIPDNPLNKEKRDIKITLSLTSFPARISCADKAIKSLMLQTVKPDRIILWLASEQFPDKKLPESLVKLTEYGLEIKWCDDLCAHKKYYYATLGQKPDEVVITYDDDIIYSPDSVKRLIKTHKKYPNCIVCERAQTLSFNKDKTVKNPGRWDTISSIAVKKPSFSACPSGGGGCLLPYGAFYKDAHDKEKIKRLALRGDDLWYMFMAAENKTPVIKTRKYHRIFSTVNNSQEFQLATDNIVQNGYEEIMENLAKEYPEAMRRILTDNKS